MIDIALINPGASRTIYQNLSNDLSAKDMRVCVYHGFPKPWYLGDKHG